MTTATFRACAVIPTYDNPRTVRDVVLGVRRHVSDVFVVDDGSHEAGAAACAALAAERLAIVHRLDTRVREGRRTGAGSFRVAFAGAMAAGVLVALASVGGLGYAATGAGSAVHKAKKVVKHNGVLVVHKSPARDQYRPARRKAKKAKKAKRRVAGRRFARPPFTGGNLVLRGASPGDSQVLLEDQEIPILYHFGGLRSTFNPRFLEAVEFVPGNFSADYGRATGGIVNVRVRDPARDELRGDATVSVYDAGFAVEGPLSQTWSLGGALPTVCCGTTITRRFLRAWDRSLRTCRRRRARGSRSLRRPQPRRGPRFGATPLRRAIRTRRRSRRRPASHHRCTRRDRRRARRERTRGRRAGATSSRTTSPEREHGPDVGLRVATTVAGDEEHRHDDRCDQRRAPDRREQERRESKEEVMLRVAHRKTRTLRQD